MYIKGKGVVISPCLHFELLYTQILIRKWGRSTPPFFKFIDNTLHYKIILHVPVFLILNYIILLRIYLLYSKRVMQISLLIG